MKAKLILLSLFGIFLYGSWHFKAVRIESNVQPPGEASARAVLSLLSWNIGYFDYERDSRAQDRDLRHIAGVIVDSGAEVIALQEMASPEQVGLLDDLLNGQFPYQALAKGIRTDRYVVIFSRLPFAEQIVIATSVGRDAVAVRFVAPGFSEITLIDCHADAFSSVRRRHFVSDLVDWSRQNGTDHILMAGDFNFDLAPVESSDLFTDDKKNDSESYSLLAEDFADLGKDAGPTSTFDRRIDYVFLHSSSLQAQEIRVLRGKLTGKMDHNPVVVRLASNDSLKATS